MGMLNLTKEEWEEIRKQVEEAARYLKTEEGKRMAAEIDYRCASRIQELHRSSAVTDVQLRRRITI